MDIDLSNIINGENIDVGGFSFNEPSMKMLIVDEENYCDHLSKQSAAVAFYGSLYKSAERKCDSLEKKYKFRYNEMYSDCSNVLSKTNGKSNVKDIEAFVYSKYKNELDGMLSAIELAKEQRDNLEVFFEAWRQKSFVLTNYTGLVTAGLLSPKTTINENEIDEAQTRRKEAIERLRGR